MEPTLKNIIIIDNAPIDTALETYFKELDIHIDHFRELTFQHHPKTETFAVLINWEILIKNHPGSLIKCIEYFQSPIIILSNSKQAELSISMLENGADDFLIKPINPRELHAKINAINRQIVKSLKKEQNIKDYLSFDQWNLYPASRQLFSKDNEELKLSTNEYNLLLAFIKQPHQILGRDFLLQITKNSELKAMDRRIDIQISRLRQKIEPEAKKPQLIKTIRNMGYIFTAQVISSKK